MKILQLDTNVDLWIAYSWGNFNQGICGHLYESIEYYYILKDHFKTKILICEDMDIQTIKKAIVSKYDFTEDELEDILNAFVFHHQPLIVKGNNLLLVDGNFNTMSNKHLYFNNIFMFSCSDLTYLDKDVIALQDQRFHPIHKTGHHYIKKILFSKLKKLTKYNPGNMVYITNGVRELSNERLIELCKDYSNIKLFTNVERYKELPHKFTYYEVPVDNPFEEFDTYIYTPIERKKDCSPRFIAECAWYNKEVVFVGIDYWEEDKGLFYRVEDIQNIDSVSLKQDDDIIRILKAEICC